ncbi:PucC family protein [Parasynechococcus sp.]|uniref:PucC family protein n=1 Tax=Parasynechococcus sp. TaxID=3101203 RepID=UPI0037048F65
MEASGGELNAPLMGLLILAFVGIGTAIAAGGTAFSALIADRTTEAERARVLSAAWGMGFLGVLLGVFW